MHKNKSRKTLGWGRRRQRLDESAYPRCCGRYCRLGSIVCLVSDTVPLLCTRISPNKQRLGPSPWVCVRESGRGRASRWSLITYSLGAMPVPGHAPANQSSLWGHRRECPYPWRQPRLGDNGDERATGISWMTHGEQALGLDHHRSLMGISSVLHPGVGLREHRRVFYALKMPDPFVRHSTPPCAAVTPRWHRETNQVIMRAGRQQRKPRDHWPNRSIPLPYRLGAGQNDQCSVPPTPDPKCRATLNPSQIKDGAMPSIREYSSLQYR